MPLPTLIAKTALFMVFTSNAFAALMTPVVVDGQEWLQPVDFVGISWNEIVQSCPKSQPVCTGNALPNGQSVEGYTWATSAQVYEMFNAFIRNTGAAEIPAGARGISGPSYEEAVKAIFDAFTPTATSSTPLGLGITMGGIVSNEFRINPTSRNGDVRRTYAVSSPRFTPHLYEMWTQTGGSLNAQFDGYGAWFFREASGSVPGPATLALMFFGLLGLRMRRIV